MEKTVKRWTGATVRKLLTCGILAVGVLLDLVVMGCDLSATDRSVWRSVSAAGEGMTYIPVLCALFIAIFCANVLSAAIGCFLSIFKKKTALFPFGISVITHLLMLTMNVAFSMQGGVAIFLIVVDLLLSVLGILYCIAYQRTNSGKKKHGTDAFPTDRYTRAMFGLGAVSMLLTLSLFVVPFCAYTRNGAVHSIVPLSALSYGSNDFVSFIVFTVLFVGAAIGFVRLLKCFERHTSSDAHSVTALRSLIYQNAVMTGGYFVAGVAYCSIRNASGRQYSTASYLPFLLMTGVMIAFAFLVRWSGQTAEPKQTSSNEAMRLEFFVYGLLISVVTVASALSDIIRVKFTVPQDAQGVHLNGLKLLMHHNSLNAGFQPIAFLLLAILTIVVSLAIASLVSFISKSKLFYKITLAEVLCGAVSALLIGLFGKYYEIVQKMNEDAILSLLGDTQVDRLTVEYTVRSQSFYWLIAVMVILAVLLVRKPYTKGTIGDMVIAASAPLQPDRSAIDARPTVNDVSERKTTPTTVDADPCPAFTELDSKIERFAHEQAKANAAVFEAPSLAGLVQFVVNYARDSRLHLSYTAEDIAAFVAGLGATRLTILQGMSGTGKTSLPKIFTEAIMGNCEIVEVESSWRDKNELLGYYNEFSRIYTPKKFTQALYKAKLNPDRLTFIVLDEMNLSRIEYYFSDFLSLMEHEEDKRAIKLLNVGLYRTEKGQKSPYLALTDGHTLKIPKNVWFIGTANRDESTFEISDKVYDRAHTMNFNKRAPKVLYRHDPIEQRYLSVEAFVDLLEDAKRSVAFDLDSSPIVAQVEALLEPYNISFGNRVALQMEHFVRIYAACFAPSNAVIADALERILLSKVVSKLEFKHIEDKAALAAEFGRLGLDRCKAFILKLDED